MMRKVLLTLGLATLFLLITSLVIFARPPITCTGNGGDITCTIANGATAQCGDNGLLDPQPPDAPAPIGTLTCTGQTGFQGGTTCVVGYADSEVDGFTPNQDPLVFLRCVNAQGQPVGPRPARHEP